MVTIWGDRGRAPAPPGGPISRLWSSWRSALLIVKPETLEVLALAPVPLLQLRRLLLPLSTRSPYPGRRRGHRLQASC